MVTFDVSHARYSSTYQDALRVDISTDCGVTFIPTGYFKQGAALATTPDQNGLFTPSSLNQWRNDTIDLAGFAGDEIKLKFVSITGYGNSLFIDNVNFHESTVGLNENNTEFYSIDAFPNPGNGNYHIEINTLRSMNFNITINDLKGSVVFTDGFRVAAGEVVIPVDISRHGKGVYLLSVQSEAGTKNIKLVIL